MCWDVLPLGATRGSNPAIPTGHKYTVLYRLVYTKT